jgi:hypothetical protein
MNGFYTVVETLVLLGVRVMVFYAIFNNIQSYHGGQFYWWRKPGENHSVIEIFKTL